MPVKKEELIRARGFFSSLQKHAGTLARHVGNVIQKNKLISKSIHAAAPHIGKHLGGTAENVANHLGTFAANRGLGVRKRRAKGLRSLNKGLLR